MKIFEVKGNEKLQSHSERALKKLYTTPGESIVC